MCVLEMLNAPKICKYMERMAFHTFREGQKNELGDKELNLLEEDSAMGKQVGRYAVNA